MQRIRILNIAALGAVLALGACNSEPEVVTVNRYDPQAEALKNAAPIAPPPMMQASRTYRCRDNSLVYIDFFSDNTAQIRTQRGEAPVAIVSAPNGTPPYTGSGYSVSANAEEINYSSPAGSKSCHT